MIVRIIRRSHPQILIESDERLSQCGDDALGIGQSVLQRVLLLAAFRHVSEYQDHAGDFTFRIADWGRTVVDGSFRAVLGDQKRMIRQADNHAVSQGSNRRAFDGMAAVLIDDFEDRFEGDTFGLLLQPAGQRFGHRIQKRDPARVVGGDDRIADAAERDAAPFRLKLKWLFGTAAIFDHDRLLRGRLTYGAACGHFGFRSFPILATPPASGPSRHGLAGHTRHPPTKRKRAVRRIYSCLTPLRKNRPNDETKRLACARSKKLAATERPVIK